LLFIFSAKSFNDAWQRIKYIRRYSTYKRLQADMIKSTVNNLSIKKSDLQVQVKEKNILLNEEQKQKLKLAKEKAEQDKIVKSFSKQEKKLKADLAAKKKEQEKINKAIKDAIKKEIANAAKANPNAKTGTGSTSSTSSSNLTLTPEAKELSNSFAGNQGKFPWPVAKGEILESFGRHQHPVLTHTETNNNGIDIKTNQGASVTTIFKGTVVSVLTNPIYHRAVLVRHGEYFTVYSNLETVNVKAGDVLTNKQVIGKAFTDSETGITMVHLEVWKGTVFMNPELWLLRK
jgi:septal ring factor EnvC (AmiA/AmiB activator)